MILENEITTITIKIDSTYSVDSVDNKPYDYTFNPANMKHADFSKTLAIHVNLFYEEYTIALIGKFYSYDTDCAVLSGEVLTILQDNSITQINIIEKTVINYLIIDCIGCNLGIYRINNGYIIHGEIEILKLNEDFEKVWAFSGMDIFSSISGKNAFEICDSSIRLFDFLENYYEIDFDGNQIDFKKGNDV